MQTSEGKEPQSITSAEFAAMFDLAILPKLRSFYLKTTPEGEPDYEDYKRQCQAFAAKLQLPPHLWSLVHLPAYISLDNATIHVWARKLCWAPRQREEVLSQYILQRYAEVFNPVPPATYEIYGPPAGPDESNAPAVAGFLNPGVQAPALSPEQQEELRRRRIMRTTIAEYNQANNCRWVQDQLHALSIEKPGMICLVPQQVMPLPHVTPDIHCPIEHLVGTIKAFVRARLLDFDVPDAALTFAVTYQRWIDEAVKERGNGDKGRWHMRRSIEKQKCICEILSTAAGVEVTVQYTFGEPNADGTYGARATEHRVRGTGGAWIADSKWT